MPRPKRPKHPRPSAADFVVGAEPPIRQEVVRLTKWEEVERPVLGARSNNLLTDEQAKQLLETAKTGRAFSVSLSDPKCLHSLRLSLAYLTKKHSLDFHSKMMGDRVLVWANKPK